MAIHVFAGHSSLLRPINPQGAALSAIIGPNIQSAPAAWLGRGVGTHEHDFLLEDADDPRVEVFALSLRDNFGERIEPLITLATLLDTPQTPTPGRRLPGHVLKEIWAHSPATTMILHAVTLPESIDGGAGWAETAGLAPARLQQQLSDLRLQLKAENGTIETQLHTVDSDTSGFTEFLNNALSAPIAARAAIHLAESGLNARSPRLATAAARVLTHWSLAGIAPALPVDTASLDLLAKQTVVALLSGREQIDA